MWLVDSQQFVPSNIGKIGCNPKIFSTSKPPPMFQMQKQLIHRGLSVPLRLERQLLVAHRGGFGVPWLSSEIPGIQHTLTGIQAF